MHTEVLFEEYRAGVLECVHHGTVCVVDEKGVVASVGDPNWLSYYRSASKPIQALPVLMRGLDKKYGLTEEETAIFSGSHCGDDDHVRVLESIMEKTGLREEQMIMLPTYPNRPGAKDKYLSAGKLPRKIYHNCSGKHLGMMLITRELGLPVEDYWVRGTKTQEEILNAITAMTDVNADDIKIGVDGCGVPVYAVPFSAIATSYLRLVKPELIKDDNIACAVQRNMEMLHKYPNMISGSNRLSTILTADEDLVGKSGAMAVYAMAIKSMGLGIVTKTMDGSHDEFSAGVLQVFSQLGYDNKEVVDNINAAYSQVIINDNKEEVGCRKAIFQLNYNK